MENFIDVQINITSKGLKADVIIDKEMIDTISMLCEINKEDVANIATKNIKCMLSELDNLVKDAKKKDSTEILQKFVDEFLK